MCTDTEWYKGFYCTALQSSSNSEDVVQGSEKLIHKKDSSMHKKRFLFMKRKTLYLFLDGPDPPELKVSNPVTTSCFGCLSILWRHVVSCRLKTAVVMVWLFLSFYYLNHNVSVSDVPGFLSMCQFHYCNSFITRNNQSQGNFYSTAPSKKSTNSCRSEHILNINEKEVNPWNVRMTDGLTSTTWS